MPGTAFYPETAPARTLGRLPRRGGARQQFSGPEPGIRKLSDLPLVEIGLGLVMVVLGTKLAAGGSNSMMRTLLLLAVCGAVVLYGFLASPYAPFYCYAFVLPISQAFGISFALILGGMVLVFLNRDRVRWKWQFSFVGAAFCLWTVVSLFWADFINTDLDSFIAQAWAPMVLALVISGIRDRTFRRNIFLLVALACVIGSTASLRNWSRGIGEMGSGGRIYSLIRPDIFSAWELFGLFGAIAWILDGRLTSWMRWAMICAVPYLLLGLGLCGFRAAILAAGFGVIIVSICKKQFLKCLILVLLAVGPVLILNYLLPSMFNTITSRFESIGEDRGSERLDIWTASAQLFWEHPVIGLGSDNFKTAITRVFGEEILPHSIYIGTMIELGIVGLVLMLAWFAVLLRKAWSSQERIWLFPLFMAYLFQAAFLHEFYFACFWVVIGLVEGAPVSKARPAPPGAGIRQLPYLAAARG